MATQLDISGYLSRRRRYLWPARFVASTALVLFLISVVSAVVAMTFVAGFASFDLTALFEGISTRLDGGTPEAGSSFNAVHFLMLLAGAFVTLLALILVICLLFYAYRRAVEAFRVRFLIPGMVVIGVVVFASGGGVQGMAIVAGVHFIIAGYVAAGAAYVGRDAIGRVLVRAPVPSHAQVLLRYGITTRRVWVPLLRLTAQLALFSGVVVAAIVVLMIYPVWAGSQALGDSLSDVFAGLGDGTVPAPAPQQGFGINPTNFILIAYAIWLRPYLGRLFVRAQREFLLGTSRTAAEVFSLDDRPGILFLRSFGDDWKKVERRRTAVEWMLGVPKRAPHRLEESLADVAFGFGPVAALRNPKLPDADHLGAARDVSTNDAWQAYVHDKLVAVADVLLMMGRSEGLRWEVETIEHHGLVDKLIVVVPQGDWPSAALRDALPRGLAFDEGFRPPLVLFRRGETSFSVTSNDTSRTAFEHALLLALAMRRDTVSKPLD